MTEDDRKKIERAAQLGKAAFEAGKMCVPAHDPAVMGLLKGKQVGDPATVAILDAWLRAWHEANLAAPVEGL